MHQCIKFILFWNDTLHVSDGLSIQHQEFKTVHTATGTCQTVNPEMGKTNKMHQCIKFTLFWNDTLHVSDDLLASRQQYLFDKWLLLCVQSLTPDDGRKDRPKHVECHSKIK